MEHVGLQWAVCLISITPILPLHLLSPGVIVTEVHKRAGLDEEQYSQVTPWNKTNKNPIRLRFHYP